MSSIVERFEHLVTGAPGDAYALYREAREHAPIFWCPAISGWVLTRHADIQAVLSDETRFGPLLAGAGSSIIHGRAILQMEGDEHRRKSAILARSIRNTRLLEGSQKDYVRSLVKQHADALRTGEVIDLKDAFTEPIPLLATAWIMDIAESPNFRQNYQAIVAAGASNLRGDPEVQRRGEQAKAELFAFITPLIEQRRTSQADDLVSVLCSTVYEGERLTDDEVRAFCSFLLAAGVETTERAMSNLLTIVLPRQDLWDRMRADRTILSSAIAEGLRYAPPVHAISRGAKVDTEFHGQKVRAGDKLTVVLASGNRDPEVFDRPEEFVIDRFVEHPEREYSARSRILSFGHGRHLCLGSLLAKLEMIEELEMLLDRFAGARLPEGVPDQVGYVLRSPRDLKVELVPA